MNRHLITGATGFFGAALTLQLLSEQPDAELVLLVRDGDLEPRRRVLNVLHDAARAYAYPDDFVDHQLARVSTVVGDLAVDPLPDTGRIERVWHSAASLRYQQHHRDEIYAVNVGGTLRALEMARAGGASMFHYISTAYVCGSASGTVNECPVPMSTRTNNAYEESKVAAEDVVQAAPDLATQILRPSVIVGHSKTGGALSDAGLYGFLRRLNHFAARAGTQHRLTLRGDPSTPINLIPVDLAAQQAVHLGHCAPDAQFVHLANSEEPTVGEALEVVCKSVGLATPRFTDDESELSNVDRALDRAIEFYRSYISGHKHFQQSAAERHGTGVSFTLTRERLRWLCAEYLRVRAPRPATTPVPSTSRAK